MEWISVEDSLPNDGNMVIVWDGKDSTHAKYTGGNYYQDISWCNPNNEFDENIDNEIDIAWITHWMPLPPPPTE